MAAGRSFFVTGSPGIGKTTLIVKVVEKLRATHPNLKVQGFYTKEVRKEGERVGFEVIAFNGGRKEMLASINSPGRLPMVGRYKVNVPGFEALALPELEPLEDTQLFVIDEVGKMELFSPKFFPAVEALLQRRNAVILGSVPIKHSSKEVEKVVSFPGVAVLTLDKKNRDEVAEKIYKDLSVLLG
ncbi:cancer-related nucleoside-triphosphatase homolog [Selaginella moellendorffii]|uniref:cancer-related nucleoside-triphosphatase homolog n=1 Tax=Selaginella moellendorffii TaxID=88036 RepID=UPI000D1C91E5|nr:cancer-related nucleoside-triphosphatase homolog [Selaginella moellendorffii]|eukprot:XP_024521468.1 cancer-related nucleoside-triphosphatase homolog [Selaginella moellendorffii]